MGIPKILSHRAQRGTTAAAHSANAKVTVSPLFPRQEIKNAINDTINAMYPSVFAVGSYDFDYVAARYSYSIPAEVENVLSVTYSTIGPSREWFPARGWQIDRTADTDAFSNGKSLSIYSEIVPGQTVHVSYSKRPTLLTNNSDDYETTIGPFTPWSSICSSRYIRWRKTYRFWSKYR